jgi:hypothetical protein
MGKGSGKGQGNVGIISKGRRGRGKRIGKVRREGREGKAIRRRMGGRRRASNFS